MRQIKFRAWDTRKKVMARVYSITSDIDEVNWVNLYGGHEVKGLVGNNNLVLMQFTGLLDKNGKEIYEGDIVYLDRGKDHEWKKDGWTSQIIWNDDNACFSEIETGDEIDREGMSRVEVIGNVMENPELLK